jgi:hypothetical protein
LAVVAQAVVLTARMAQVAVALAKYCKQRFILTQQHTQLRSVLVVHPQQIKQAVTDLVHALRPLHWQLVAVAVQVHQAIEHLQARVEVVVVDLV